MEHFGSKFWRGWPVRNFGLIGSRMRHYKLNVIKKTVWPDQKHVKNIIICVPQSLFSFVQPTSKKQTNILTLFYYILCDTLVDMLHISSNILSRKSTLADTFMIDSINLSAKVDLRNRIFEEICMLIWNTLVS